jgi:hypothetical protein
LKYVDQTKPTWQRVSIIDSRSADYPFDIKEMKNYDYNAINQCMIGAEFVKNKALN